VILDAIADQATRRPGAEALRAGDRALSYEELVALSGGIAARLRDIGVGPTDRARVVDRRDVPLRGRVVQRIGLIVTGERDQGIWSELDEGPGPALGSLRTEDELERAIGRDVEVGVVEHSDDAV